MTIIISDEAVNIALNTWLGGVPAWRNNATERLRTEMRDALTAALPFLSVQGAVKKLEWGKARITEDGREAEEAESPVGRYIAADTGWFLLGRTDYEAERGLYQSKAAAQADYETRILSALEPSAARDLALEQAEAALQKIVNNWGNLHHKDLMQARAAIRAISSPDHADADTLETYYARQIEWSKNTFGPALRTKGIIDHINKELEEIEAEPHDLSEWIDVVILAMDGFWRHGGSVNDLMPRLLAKQQKNMARAWPDWRTMSEDQAIEHDRSFDTDQADAGKVEGDVEKWSIREIVAKAIAYHSVGDPHAKTIRGDQRWEWFLEEADKFISVFGYYLPALPSAPSEGAE